LFFGVLGLTPLLLLAYLTLTLSVNAMREQSQLHLRSTSAVAAVFVAQHFSGLAEVVQAYAARSLLVDALRSGDRSQPDVSSTIRHLGQLQKTREGIAATFVADLQGELIAIVPETPAIVGQSFSHRDWYRGVLKNEGRPYVSEVYRSAATGNPRVVAVAALIHDRSRVGEPAIAILVAAYSTAYVQRFTEQFAKAQGVRLSITDQRGVLVAEPSRPKLTDALRPLRSSGVVAALQGKTGVTQSVEVGGPSLLAYAPVPGMGWAVTSSVSVKQALAPMHSLRRTVLMITALLAGVLFVGLGYFYVALRKRREAEASAHREAQRVTSMLTAAHDAFVSIDGDSRITAWNKQAERTFGWSADEIIGRKLTETLIPPEQRTAHIKGVDHLLVTGHGPILNQRVELTALRADGSKCPVELAVWTVPGERREFSAFMRDITQRRADEAALRALHEELRVSARTDALTGLGNRLRLEEDLKHLHARSARYGHHFGVALLDVDFFKLYNDSCGHLAGDAVLRQVATTIAHAARSGDSVYRFGGEEMLCILPEQSQATAAIAAERLRRAVEALAIEHPARGTAGIVTVSIGVASHDGSGSGTIEQLLKSADDALYLAKQQGRNCVRARDPTPDIALAPTVTSSRSG
jgi:diguanylate cyclase (GGDEF)-like protein/PAS domain S-box-containing protein